MRKRLGFTYAFLSGDCRGTFFSVIGSIRLFAVFQVVQSFTKGRGGRLRTSRASVEHEDLGCDFTINYLSSNMPTSILFASFRIPAPLFPFSLFW
jgi:hypothetical protein